MKWHVHCVSPTYSHLETEITTVRMYKTTCVHNFRVAFYWKYCFYVINFWWGRSQYTCICI